MIRVDDLISVFKKMLDEHWSYEWGAAREGCVDCSGAFRYAFKLLGGEIYHGSNTILRSYCKPFVRACDAKKGMAVFKWSPKNTPHKFNDTLGNFYHIGLYDGRRVIEAANTKDGMRSSPLSDWDYAAELKGVDYTPMRAARKDKTSLRRHDGVYIIIDGDWTVMED